MAMLKAKGRQTSAVSVESENSDVYLRAMRDGSLINMPWVMAKVFEGKVFCAMTGVLSADVTFAPVVAGDMPDLTVLVPGGTTIIPVYISVNFEDTGTPLVLDVLAIASKVYDNDVTSTTTLVIKNMRTDKAVGGSQCTALFKTTSGGTDLESAGYNYVEFWRPVSGFAEDAFANSTARIGAHTNHAKWTIGDAVVPPIIVGTSTLGIYAGAQAGKGFITAIWVEVPTAELI